MQIYSEISGKKVDLAWLYSKVPQAVPKQKEETLRNDPQHIKVGSKNQQHHCLIKIEYVKAEMSSLPHFSIRTVMLIMGAKTRWLKGKKLWKWKLPQPR